MTPEECLTKAKQAERLAATVSTLADKKTLLEAAEHWRLLAAATAGTEGVLKGSLEEP